MISRKLLKENILEGAKKQYLIKELKYPKDSVERYCRHRYKISYKQLVDYFCLIDIIHYCNVKCSREEILEKVFSAESEESHLSRYLSNHIGTFKTISDRIGGKYMSKDAQKVLAYLGAARTRMPAFLIAKSLGMRIGVVRKAIVELRELGFKVVSLPGRYKSGYLLNDNVFDVVSANWINNLRDARFQLPRDFSY